MKTLMRRMVVVVAALLMAAAGVVTARGDQVFKDDFNRDSLGPNYATVGNDGGSATITGGKLKVDMTGVTGTWKGFTVRTDPAVFSNNFTAGSFLKVDALYTNLARTRLDFGSQISGIAYRHSKDSSPSPPNDMTRGQNGFYIPPNTDTLGGSTQIWANVERSFAAIYIGDPNGDGTNTVRTFLKGASGDPADATVWRHNASFAHTNLFPVNAKSVYMGWQHNLAGTAANYCTFDNLVAYNREMAPGGTAAITSALHLAYADDFNRAPASLGPDWTVTVSGASSWSYGVTNNQVEVKLLNTNGVFWPSHTARLALTNSTVLGRGVRVGEYIEVDLARSSNDQTQFGVGLGSVGNDARPRFQPGSTSKPLGIYRKPFGSDQGGANWTAISEQNFDPIGSGDKVTLGCRLDYADGDFMVIGYYINGNYVGSWLAGTSETEIKTFDLLTQGNVHTRTFYYDNLRIYITPPPKGTAITFR